MIKKTISIISINCNNKKILLINNNSLKLYVCGITPYDYAHIGHGRCYIVFDVLVRLSRFLNQNITYCRNITDIDDKLIKRAKEVYNNSNQYSDIALHYYNEYLKNMDQLNCLRPDCEPKATNYIDKIIKDIEKLIENKYAYCSNGDVFFSVDKFSQYGTISNRSLNEQLMGSRVEINEGKNNSLDFVIWKKSDQEPLWNSPWGNGRPGWHIECSTMIQNLFGEKIDIHGGGHDLLFPHHENENIIFTALNKTDITDLWIHCAFINLNHQKMSKSLNNSIILNDFFTKYDPMIFRYYVLNHHYKTPIEFSWSDIESFEKAYNSLINLFNDVIEFSFENEYNHKLIEDIYNCACNDLNISAAIGLIFKNINEIKNDFKLKVECKKFLVFICGLSLEKINEDNNNDNNNLINYSDEIKDLIKKRNKARANKNFALADEIRNELIQFGVEVKDFKI